MTVTTLRVPGLDPVEQETLSSLLEQLHAKTSRNLLRAAYYDGKNAVRSLGIAMPPSFQRVATVLGWPAKSVDVLNRRCNLDGFVIPDGSVEDLGVPELWDENNLNVEAPQAGISSLIHSTAFLITTLGDQEAGEPSVVITARSALSGTGIWDPRRRGMSSFLSIIAVAESGDPTEMVMYLPSGNVSMTFTANAWTVSRREHSLGRVPVEPLVYQPRLGRPFGSSRISRPVMSLTDMALRTVIRSEVAAELYSVPQRVLLGADESSFMDAAGNVKSMWQAILGRVWAIDRDDEGNVPTMQEFTAASQQPHMDQLKSLGQLFAGETSIPISSLGISTDSNPTSAEAYYASRDDLILEAEGTTDGWSQPWVKTILTAIQLRDGLDSIPPELLKMRAKWRNAATPSRAASADAMLKMVQAFPWMAESEVALEELGFDDTQIQRLLADKRRYAGSAALRALTSAAAAQTAPASAVDVPAG